MLLPRLESATAPARAAPLFAAGTPPPPPFLALVEDGVAVELPLRRADLRLAADRPDRLDAAFSAGPLSGLNAPPFRPGARWRVSLAGREVFSGNAARIVRRTDGRDGPSLEVVAHARYHALRAARPTDIYYQSTSAEIAARIARELELAAVIEPTEPIHRRLVRREDPLRFLRRLASEAGFGLAVAAGKLYFRRDVAAGGGSCFVNRKALVSWEEMTGGEGHEGRASLVIAGDPGLRPLARVRLASGAEYLALRVVHRLEAAGFTTAVDLVSCRGEGAS